MPTCDPIGTVHTPFTSTADAPRQGFLDDAEGTIVLEEAYEAGLAGLRPGEDVLVVWFADRADRTRLTVERDGGRGVFTTRSPSRPNPVCLTTCEVRSVAHGTVGVRGVDMLDGSPVLDLKPPLSPGR